MSKLIPAPIIGLLSEIMPQHETHASLDSLFMYADAPGEPPEESKPVKVQEWLRRINKDESVEPLKILVMFKSCGMGLFQSEEFEY